jgi:hypothetical protein
MITMRKNVIVLASMVMLLAAAASRAELLEVDLSIFGMD